VHTWRIWRDGRELFHVVECEDYQAMRAALRDHPANVAWQARMDELLEVADDYSGGDTGLPQVWELPTVASLAAHDRHPGLAPQHSADKCTDPTG